jgi:hypothetical protein
VPTRATPARIANTASTAPKKVAYVEFAKGLLNGFAMLSKSNDGY